MSSRAHKVARCLHFIGLAMVLGSLLGHIALHAMPGAGSDPDTLLFVRQAIAINTRMFMGPGLVLILLTGIFLTVRLGGFLKRRWLTVHQVLGLLVVLNALLILRPIGAELLSLAQGIVAGTATMEALQSAAHRELLFGPGNLILALLATAIAVFRPALGQSHVASARHGA